MTDDDTGAALLILWLVIEAGDEGRTLRLTGQAELGASPPGPTKPIGVCAEEIVVDLTGVGDGDMDRAWASQILDATVRLGETGQRVVVLAPGQLAERLLAHTTPAPVMQRAGRRDRPGSGG